jgi:ribonucleotide reductase alpha subunit
MKIARHYTKSGQSPYGEIAFHATRSEIRNPDGSVVFSQGEIEVPAAWSQVAADILAQKYFRKAGVPARLERVEERGLPSLLLRSVADIEALASLPKSEQYGGETSAKQVFDRLAGAWCYWGWKGHYFDTEEDARAFFDELHFMLARQIASPNSPQWFNSGQGGAFGTSLSSRTHAPPGTMRFRSASSTATQCAGECHRADGHDRPRDTTGIEPDFALLKFKKLAGGGYFKIINRAVPEGLRALGYRAAEIDEITAHATGHATLGGAPALDPASPKGFSDEKQAALDTIAEERSQARMKGYRGDACGECGNFTLLRAGVCLKCCSCGQTTGCS